MGITSRYLEAALIDQFVAGRFAEQFYAYNSVYSDQGKWILGIMVANEAGYSPLAGKTFNNEAEANTWARELNKHIGRSDSDVIDILVSTMGGRSIAIIEARAS